MAADAPRIVLTMIVKDEAHVIERCFASMRPFIDAYLIVDTGSSDGTQKLIRRKLEGLPGEVVDRQWVDFATNRTQALELARPFGEYSLMIDADVECRLDAESDPIALRSSLSADVYRIELHDGIRYQRPLLTSTRLPFSYRGVLHEFLVTPDGAVDGGILSGLHYRSNFDGARSTNPNKFIDDAALLTRALASGDEPDLAARYTFYLAQSLRDAGNVAGAEMAYRARASMGGWPEEVYVSLLWQGRLLRTLRRPLGESLETLARAQELCPARAEAWCEAATQARAAGLMQLAHACARRASECTEPVDGLFLETDCYRWRGLYEFALAAFYGGDLGGGARACHRLLYEDLLPVIERQAIVDALAFYPEDAFTYA
jgi:hypothetical protein